MGATVYRNEIIVSKVADDLVPYCLRHTYGTDLQDAGVPINVAKYLMGHSDITVTANIYTHTTLDALTETSKKINEYHKSYDNK
jgi:site-specific recombinase XerD